MKRGESDFMKTFGVDTCNKRVIKDYVEYRNEDNENLESG